MRNDNSAMHATYIKSGPLCFIGFLNSFFIPQHCTTILTTICWFSNVLVLRAMSLTKIIQNYVIKLKSANGVMT